MWRLSLMNWKGWSASSRRLHGRSRQRAACSSIPPDRQRLNDQALRTGALVQEMNAACLNLIRQKQLFGISSLPSSALQLEQPETHGWHWLRGSLHTQTWGTCHQGRGSCSSACRIGRGAHAPRRDPRRAQWRPRLVLLQLQEEVVEHLQHIYD